MDGKIAEINTTGYLFWRSGTLVNAKDLLKEDWMPYKDKKQIVVKNVNWYKSGTTVYPSSFHRSNNLEDSNSWDEVLNKPGMTMTLTWEE